MTSNDADQWPSIEIEAGEQVTALQIRTVDLDEDGRVRGGVKATAEREGGFDAGRYELRKVDGGGDDE